MKKEEYIQTQQQLLCLISIIKDMPLKEFLHKIDICESVSPLIDPTLYMKGADKLTFIKCIAEGARHFQDVIKTQMLEIESEGAFTP